mgnify:CR=1 FL=1
MVAILEPGLAWTEMATVDGGIRRRQPGNSPPAAPAAAAAAGRANHRHPRCRHSPRRLCGGPLWQGPPRAAPANPAGSPAPQRPPRRGPSWVADETEDDSGTASWGQRGTRSFMGLPGFRFSKSSHGWASTYNERRANAKRAFTWQIVFDARRRQKDEPSLKQVATWAGPGTDFVRYCFPYFLRGFFRFSSMVFLLPVFSRFWPVFSCFVLVFYFFCFDSFLSFHFLSFMFPFLFSVSVLLLIIVYLYKKFTVCYKNLQCIKKMLIIYYDIVHLAL